MGYKYGCDENKDSWIEQAEKVLFEKYGETFEILAIGGSYGTIMNNTYSVICRPISNKECVFEAEIHKDKSFVLDTYISALMASQVKVAFEKELQHITNDFFVHVGYMNRFYENADTSISFEEYASNSMSKFNVYIAFDESIVDVAQEKLISVMDTAIKTLVPFKGYIKISVLDRENIKWLRTYMEARAYADARFFDTFNPGRLNKYTINNGSLVGEE